MIGIPVLRLKGDYLAIVTLAFGEIIKNILNNLYVGVDGSGLHVSMSSVKELGMDAGTVIINGPMGAVGITKLSTFFAGFVLILITLFVTLNLIKSRSGRAIMAIRDNRIAAESVGINITKYKLIAFVVSALLAGMAGAIYAMNYSTIVPKKFDFNTFDSDSGIRRAGAESEISAGFDYRGCGSHGSAGSSPELQRLSYAHLRYCTDSRHAGNK